MTPQKQIRATGFAATAAFLLFVGLALFGSRYHWVEEAGTAERDGYVAQAEEILAGRLPRDPFRPLLYPLLTAVLGGLLGNPFAAARLLSNAAAAVLAYLAYRFGRRLGGPAVGGWALAATTANPNLWILGQHVTPDMLFAALGAMALLAGLVYLERPSRGAALVGGGAYGLALFTRGNALFLLPGLLLAWWLAPGERREKVKHLSAAALLAILLLVPHWVLRHAAFGDPFYDENWKNLAWKLYGYPDWSYLERVPYEGLWEVVRSDPWGVATAGVAETARFVRGGLAQLLGTWFHVLLFAAGSLLALRRRPRESLWLLAALGMVVGATAAAFFAWGRLLLLLLPPAFALAFVWLEPGGIAGRREWLRRKEGPPREGPPLVRAAQGVALAAVLLLAVKTAFFRLPAFVQRHPYLEVAVLRSLEGRVGPAEALAGTSPSLGRYVEREYVYIPDAFGPEVEAPGLYLAKIRPLLQEKNCRYLVVGRVDLRDRPRELLAPIPPAPWLERAGGDGRVAIWRVLLNREDGEGVPSSAGPDRSG